MREGVEKLNKNILTIQVDLFMYNEFWWLKKLMKNVRSTRRTMKNVKNVSMRVNVK